ncbi:MAG: prepilin-type N-terminal cleavage/methylation domain-containing protein [Heliobacteriaceae bacterium]|nr:prepilin-type N-terminal cleavage/methylation domain-containing protein [Heliobacteriaceae bacterium]
MKTKRLRNQTGFTLAEVLITLGIISNILNTREDALIDCRDNLGGYSCSTLLLYDNWEFKDDYPYRL